MFMPSNDTNATHVKIVEDKYKHFELCNVTPGRVYVIHREVEDGDDMIVGDNGQPYMDFANYLDVEWLKQVDVQ